MMHFTVAATIPSFRWNSVGETVIGIAGSTGTTAKPLHGPRGLAFDSSNILYIADSQHHRVQIWLPGTSIGSTVAGDAGGKWGTGPNYLNQPSDVAVDSNRNIYVVDTYNHRVQFWTSGAVSGTTIAGTGKKIYWRPVRLP
jgi:hypothetical protein